MGIEESRRNMHASPTSGNSTVTPLGIGATFTGDWEQNNQPEVMVMCKTDKTGTIFFDFSPDGLNVDSTFPVLGFAVAPGVTEFHTAVKGPRYFRVRLVNYSGAQSYLRLTTYYGSDFIPTVSPLNQSIGTDQDAIVTRSVLVGQDSDDNYVNVPVTKEGKLGIDNKNENLLKEILVELKINNQYMKHVVGEANEVVESDVETRR